MIGIYCRNKRKRYALKFKIVIRLVKRNHTTAESRKRKGGKAFLSPYLQLQTPILSFTLTFVKNKR